MRTRVSLPCLAALTALLIPLLAPPVNHCAVLGSGVLQGVWSSWSCSELRPYVCELY